MARVFRSIEDLYAAGLLTSGDPALPAVAERYAVGVTPEIAALIDRSDPADPIARQFLPDARELEMRPEELADPIGDEAHSPVKGVVHRYPDRVLLKPLLACPVYCRFCFRREFVGPGSDALNAGELGAALDYIRRQTGVWEVILTGGDPLMLAPRRIAELVGALSAIGHVRTLRWHSRVPVVDPDRISAELVAALTSTDRPIWLAVHCNHPRELTEKARAALGRLAGAGINLLSQTVLLRGVNDDPETLSELMRRFVENSVKPYYLHQMDLAPGTSHFRVPLPAAQRIVAALRGRLSGIAQPTFMLDIPGGYGKVPAGPSFVEDLGGGHFITDPGGAVHAYRPSTDS
jgi:lysine 2,3-aminomutase